MNLYRINEILSNKEKCDIYYDNRLVWIQKLDQDVATVGFIDNFEEKDVYIDDLFEH